MARKFQDSVSSPSNRSRRESSSSQPEHNRRLGNYDDMSRAGPSHQGRHPSGGSGQGTRSNRLFSSQTRRTRLYGPILGKDSRMLELERRGFPQVYQGTEQRWFPKKRVLNRRRLRPQNRHLDQIRRSYMKMPRSSHRSRPNYERSGMDDRWNRSRQLVRRSRNILNRRPRDLHRERMTARRREKQRQWTGMRDRRAFQKSQYMTREQNIGRVRRMMRDRRVRAITGERPGRVSQRSQRQIVPSLPRHLESIPEEDEEIE